MPRRTSLRNPGRGPSGRLRKELASPRSRNHQQCAPGHAAVRAIPVLPITDCQGCRGLACRTGDHNAVAASGTSRSATPALLGSRASAPPGRAVKWDGRGLMRRSLALLVVHRDCCPSLVEREPVTLAAQALMEVGTCTAILTGAFVVRLPVISLISLSRLVLSRTLFPAVRLSHRSSSHHRTLLVHPGLAHTTPSSPV